MTPPPLPHAMLPAGRRTAAWLGWLGLLPLAVAAAAPPPAPAADPLPGRLFHSAAERAALDRSERMAHQPPPRAGRPAPAPPPERSDTLSGFVLRSDGRDSFWLDGAPTGLRR